MFMKNNIKLLFIFFVFCCLISCKKDNEVVVKTNNNVPLPGPLASVAWHLNSTSYLPIDLDGNSSTDIMLQWTNWNGLGAGGGAEMNVIMLDSNWQVLTRTYVNTTCVDTVYRNGVRTFSYSTGANCTNTFSTDTITFANNFDSAAIYNPTGMYQYRDTTMSYYTNNVQPGIASPDAKYYAIRKGASEFNTGSYIIFKNDLGIVKAIRHDFFRTGNEPPRYYLMKIISL